MLEYLAPAEARHTPIYAAVMADFLGRAASGPRRPRDAAGRFVKAPRQCRQAACGRSAAHHMWDAETCPEAAPKAVADE